jgi:tetratricopeptide (TPR) repeat protein
MAGARTFVVRFLADAEQYKKGIKQVNDGMGGLKTQVSSLLPSFKTMAIAGAAAFGSVSAFTYKAVQAAAEDQKSQALLALQIKQTTNATDQQIESTMNFIGALQMSAAVSEEKLRPALAILVRGTGDLSEAQRLLQISLDISAGSGKDLEAVSTAISRAANGSFTALSKLGVPLDENTVKTKDFNAATSQLGETFQGASAAAANTFTGQMTKLKLGIGEITESIGKILLPYFEKFVGFINDKIVPAVQIFVDNFKDKGVGGALAMATASMGTFGETAVNVLEAAYVSLLTFTHDLAKTVRILADAASLGFALQGNVVGAGKALVTAIAMSKVQDATNEALAGAGAMFDNFRMKVYMAQLQLAQLGKPPKDVSDSLDRMSQSGLRAANSVKDVAKELGGSTGGGGVAKAVKTATEKLKEYTDALKSSNSAQKAFTQAQKASVKAGESLTAANQGLADAQAAFNAAVAGYGADSPQARKAAKELELAQRGLERAGYNVEGSLFAVANAEEALKKVRADPESTPQAIREAEIALAEAKLSSADAVDAQTEATNGLTKATGLLNDAVFGASVGSDIYTQLSDALTDAKEKQADAVDAVAEAIDRETEALKNYADAIEAVGKIVLLYPKVVADNPIVGLIPNIPVPQTGNSTGFDNNGTPIVINVNAGIVSTPDQIAQELSNLSDRYRRLNGGGGFF